MKKIETIKHPTKSRLNNPTAENEALLAEEEATSKQVSYPRLNNPDENPDLYERDKRLDPQLVWRGKDEEDRSPLKVASVPIYIQEEIEPKMIIDSLRKQTAEDKVAEGRETDYLFDEQELDHESRLEFYAHEKKWSNRMILGDSLPVMTSLMDKEVLRGNVQCIYFDPPYGIKFESNWQPSTKGYALKGEAREPEVIKAFRDTWRHGINSYLSYIRDRLQLMREMLTESGSIFVQISEENQHRMRMVLDEIFGPENFVSMIYFATTGLHKEKDLTRVGDYLLWYAKDKEQYKYRPLYLDKSSLKDAGKLYQYLETADRKRRAMTKEERVGSVSLPEGSRIYRLGDLQSMGGVGEPQPFEFESETFRLRKNSRWMVGYPDGLSKLKQADRLEKKGNGLFYVRFADDFPVKRLTNSWMDTIAFAPDKRYVVETRPKVVERCILMTTDPGDLVFDPTCGSGTTAYAAEKWGRRWVTCDTSKVALTLARQRLMTAKFDWYKLKDQTIGVTEGFNCATIPYITPKSITKNPEIREGMDRVEAEHAIKRYAGEEILYDRPEIDKNIVRITGPFTVESLSPHRILPVDPPPDFVNMESEIRFQTIIFDNLKIAGIQNTKKNERIEFESLDKFPGCRHIHFDGRYRDADDKQKKVAICVGPEYGTVSRQLVSNAAREAADIFDLLIVLGFAFEAHADEEVMHLGKLRVQRANIHNDLRMADKLAEKSATKGNLFVLYGEADIELLKDENDLYRVKINGIDIYNPKTGDITSGGDNDVACWFVDTNYDEERFVVRQAYFAKGGQKEPFQALKTALKSEINEQAWASLYKTVSNPFKKPENGLIAVKAINHQGEEVLKVMGIDKANSHHPKTKT